MPSSRPDRSVRRDKASRLERSSTGITRSLQIIVDSAIVSTITMPVAADSPPMKTSSASASRRCTIGRLSTKVSASTWPGANCISPAKVIGSTKMLIARR